MSNPKKQLQLALATTACLIAWSLPIPASAQSDACMPGSPLLGSSGPELCVRLSDPAVPGSETYLRPGAQGITMAPTAVGEYTVALAIAYTAGPGGLSITMTGPVTRSLPGNGKVMVHAQGGLGGPFPESLGSLRLTGASTGTSWTEVGGGAGRLAPTAPPDVQYRGFPPTISIPTYGPEAFDQFLLNLPVVEEAVAVSLTTVFHINDVGDTVTIPSGAGIAPPGAPAGGGALPGAGAGGPHFECYDVAEGSMRRIYEGIRLEDQFDSVKTRIGDITRLCTPVSKNDEEVPDPELHLLCYRILDSHNPEIPVRVDNQFGEAVLRVRKARELCVPSIKTRMDREIEEEEGTYEQEYTREQKIEGGAKGSP